MNPRNSIVPLAAALALAGCAAPEGYPDLQIRDVERVSGAFDAPETIGYTPAPVSPATIEHLDELVADARAAHETFTAAAEAARAPVEAARGAPMGGENWAVAQVAVANLEAQRSAVMVALADIDRIYLTAATEGGEVARIEQVLGEVNALVEEENRVIAGFLDTIGS